jgi:diacylglycerol kinase family enzyme
MTVVFANGQWFGGAFRIAPAAQLDDGALDVVGIADVPALTRAALFARALRGKHVGHPAVHTATARDLTVEFGDRPYIQIDGELQRSSSRSVRVRCLPSALRVIR